MDKDKLSRISAIALNSLFGYEPIISHRIIEALGSPEAVFSLSPRELDLVLGPFSSAREKLRNIKLEQIEEETDRLAASGYSIVTFLDDCYPSLLKECPDAPVALYIRSSTPVMELFSGRPFISVVGTRDISLYGKDWCSRIVEAISMAPVKPVIVSGLAFGVDICAHLAALENGLPTIAVLPVGINDVYPKRHVAAAGRIASSPGSALITDYPPGTSPIAINFIRRNRIIAGLSRATILIESKQTGGGMLTARLAADYGRDVFALPGRIDDIRSRGCLTLLAEKTAEIITDPFLLSRNLGLGEYSMRRKQDVKECVEEHLKSKVMGEDLNRLTAVALDVRACRGISVEELCRKEGMEYREICRLVGILENEGFLSMDLLQRCTFNTKILTFAD